jgi:hypothetical protein
MLSRLLRQRLVNPRAALYPDKVKSLRRRGNKHKKSLVIAECPGRPNELWVKDQTWSEPQLI